MGNKPRYTIKKYMLLIVISATVGVILSAVILSLIGFDTQGTLVVVILTYPVWLFSCLYGFYKGLVRYYGLSSNEKLFLGGKF